MITKINLLNKNNTKGNINSLVYLINRHVFDSNAKKSLGRRFKEIPE